MFTRQKQEDINLAQELYKKNTELQDKKEELEVLNNKLKALDEQKDEFISFASHELKTPVSVVKNNLFMLRTKAVDVLDSELLKYFEEADRGLVRLSNLIENLLNISRIESGRLVVDMKPHDIIPLITESCEGFQEMYQSKGVTLSCEGLPSSLVVQTDSDRFTEVLDNYISNALKYTENGEVKVYIKQGDTRCIVAVEDTGHGISQKDYDKMFTKFGRATEGLKLKSSGASTGLGLYIVKRMVEEMGGEVGFRTKPNIGSVFYFTVRKSSLMD